MYLRNRTEVPITEYPSIVIMCIYICMPRSRVRQSVQTSIRTYSIPTFVMPDRAECLTVEVINADNASSRRIW